MIRNDPQKDCACALGSIRASKFCILPQTFSTFHKPTNCYFSWFFHRQNYCRIQQKNKMLGVVPFAMLPATAVETVEPTIDPAESLVRPPGTKSGGKW